LEADPDFWQFLSLFLFQVYPLSFGTAAGLLIIIILLCGSAMISGSEVAYFSLDHLNIEQLKNSEITSDKLVIRHLSHPEKLLATILVTNNFINVGIVILSSFITTSLFDFSENPVFGFVFKVIIITFLILFFGEIIPKIYANQYPVKFSKLMARPLVIFTRIFWPLSIILVKSTSVVNKKLAKKKRNISIEELSDALDMTDTTIAEDKKILKGIIKFGNIDVKEIMQARVDVIGTDIKTKFNDLIPVIMDSGYSRIPVFEETLDHILGILYIKDLLPHIHKKTFNWQTLIRPPYYVPETKKISDLLKEFQLNKIHLAIVIDEYGGTSGIITLEDILEEIVGEITDEYDEEEIHYKKINENTYIFEGKIQLHDFYKILNIYEDTFNEIEGDYDTLAGLILELRGEIPEKDDKLSYKDFVFKIRSVDNRRIKEIQVSIRNIDKYR